MKVSLQSEFILKTFETFFSDKFEFVSVPNNPVIPVTIGNFVITNVIVTDVNYDGVRFLLPVYLNHTFHALMVIMITL